MDLFQINQQTCHQDGICAAVCPIQIIDFKKGAFPGPAAEAEELCIRCGHCVAACPTGSFFHREMPADTCPPVRKDLPLSIEHCEQFLRSRRSIRNYKEKPVPREALARLIEIAAHAPSGHNGQCARWLVVDDKDALTQLAAIVIDWMRWMIRHMPEAAASYHMDRVLQRWENGRDVILRDAPALVIAHAEKDNRSAPSTCTIALAYLELAAASLDLGCCWAGYFMAAAANFPAMQTALALPDGHQCFGAMMIGYPRYRYQRLPLRNTPVIAWRP